MYKIYCDLRNAKGCRDSDVAKATNITKSTFSDWKNGRSEPKTEKLLKIADYFGVSFEYLTTGKEPPKDYSVFLDNDIKCQLDNVVRILDKDEPILFDGNKITLTNESRQIMRNAFDIVYNILKQNT